MEGQSDTGNPASAAVTVPPAIEREPAPSIFDLRAAAAGGSVEALAALRQLTLDRAEEGVVPIEEALSAAEVYAHLAAVRGGRDDRWHYASLLIARSDRFRAAGEVASAEWYRSEAGRHLRALDSEGDETAAAALADLGLALAVIEPERERIAASIDDTMLRAASGDTASLAVIVDGCISGMHRQTIGPAHALAMAEEAGWLAASGNDPVMVAKLVGVLMLRGFHAWDDGRPAVALIAMADAVALSLNLIAANFGNTARDLTALLDTLPAPLLALVADVHPAALAFVTSAGAA